MPNINQQKHRVRSAARQRLENLRWRSTVKTLQRRLEAAVADGDKERIASEHRELVRWLDKAAAQGRTQEVSSRQARRLDLARARSLLDSTGPGHPRPTSRF